MENVEGWCVVEQKWLQLEWVFFGPQETFHSSWNLALTTTCFLAVASQEPWTTTVLRITFWGTILTLTPEKVLWQQMRNYSDVIVHWSVELRIFILTRRIEAWTRARNEILVVLLLYLLWDLMAFISRFRVHYHQIGLPNKSLER